MKYLDNLIAWGDCLFRQDTIETINEATQIYVLAANLLGPKPQQVPPRGKRRRRRPTRSSRPTGIDAFGNALVELENAFPFNSLAAAPAAPARAPDRRRVRHRAVAVLLHPAATTSCWRTGTRSATACSRSATA